MFPFEILIEFNTHNYYYFYTLNVSLERYLFKNLELLIIRLIEPIKDSLTTSLK